MQALVDTGIHKLKDICFHQAVECCSSLSIESSSDGGGELGKLKPTLAFLGGR